MPPPIGFRVSVRLGLEAVGFGWPKGDVALRRFPSCQDSVTPAAAAMIFEPNALNSAP